LEIAQEVIVAQRRQSRMSSSAMTSLVGALALTWPPVMHHVVQVSSVPVMDLTIETLAIAQGVIVAQRRQSRMSSSAMTRLVGALALTWPLVMHLVVQVLFAQRKDLTVETSVTAQRVTAAQKRQKQISMHSLTVLVGVQAGTWQLGMHRALETSHAQGRAAMVENMVTAQRSTVALRSPVGQC